MVTSLLSRLRRSNRADFEREMMPHLGSLYAVALRLTRNERDAEDLVQDTALRAYRFFHRYEAGSNSRAWLFKILHNTFLTRYRRRSREREVLEQLAEEPTSALAEEPDDPEKHLLTEFLSEDVRRALDRLPEEFRTAVVLCDLEEFSYKEIAEIMECPVGTVMSRLHRGRRMLQEALRGYAQQQGIGKTERSSAAESVAPVIPLRRGE
ncbi:MAG TPA: sigma-70 family RNA polymerase sigma factor [Polyangia bacterium]|jgi:RNA polymerase sigma-70 factor (ECF subfamily)|nr:sigma-70 family RNA polymerase sigma factor [Polyangia bacterium]